ncbi:MAG: hypothetical protein OXC30_00390 [Alphaproteobacteria bacterium]|nr:hypothetical protein [Alphaproteobacteria bacterium]
MTRVREIAMKISWFKLVQHFTLTTEKPKAILFHGNLPWYIDFCALTFMQKTLKRTQNPLVHFEKANEFFAAINQQTFFEDVTAQATPCVTGVESSSVVDMRSLLQRPEINDTVVMVSHHYLKPSVGVRKLFEKSNELIIVPIYEPNAHQVQQYVQSFFDESRQKIMPDALHMIAQQALYFSDNLLNILRVCSFYHHEKTVEVSGVRECLNAMYLKPDIMKAVVSFCAKNEKDFYAALAYLDLNDTTEMLMFLRLMHDALMTLLLLQKNLLSPSDFKVLKWQSIAPYRKSWAPQELNALFVWIAESETHVKKQQFFQQVDFLIHKISVNKL